MSFSIFIFRQENNSHLNIIMLRYTYCDYNSNIVFIKKQYIFVCTSVFAVVNCVLILQKNLTDLSILMYIAITSYVFIPGF